MSSTAGRTARRPRAPPTTHFADQGDLSFREHCATTCACLSLGLRRAPVLPPLAGADPTPSIRAPARARARTSSTSRCATRPSSRTPATGTRADSRLRIDRLPRRRVPLPGLALRRQRRARQPGHERPACRRQRFLALGTGLTSIRPTPRSTATTPPTSWSCGRAAGDLDRLPSHAQHDQGLEGPWRDDRDRGHAGERCVTGPTAPTSARPRSTS